MVASSKLIPPLFCAPGDIAAISGRREVLVQQVDGCLPEVGDAELLDIPAERVDVFVTNPNVDGKTLQELSDFPFARGAFLRRVLRNRMEMPITLELSVTALIPHLVGVLVGHRLFKMHPGILLGVCAGAGTATPALAAVQEPPRALSRRSAMASPMPRATFSWRCGELSSLRCWPEPGTAPRPARRRIGPSEAPQPSVVFRRGLVASAAARGAAAVTSK